MLILKTEEKMAIKKLSPEKQDNKKVEIVNKKNADIERFNEDFDHFFDDFFGRPFSIFPFQRGMHQFTPRLDVFETDHDVKVTVEIPGMDERDIEVSINNGILSISGEKSSEHVEKNGQYHRMERSYGSFRRDVLMPSEVDENKVAATFSKGVLEVTLPKITEENRKSRKIEVKKG
jgi:HSP20 family protein